METSSHHVGSQYLTAAQVRARFGNISDMSLWRWINSSQLNFPKPIYINRRRFFREDLVLDWEARRRHSLRDATPMNSLP